MLIETTHAKPWSLTKEVRYTDTTISEQERGISITSTPISLLLSDSKDKSWLLNFVDTPGHISLTGEITAALRIADGCVVCVDVVEGVMLNTERCIRQCVAQNIPMILAFTKMDRLITDLKMPPVDAYFKLVAMLEEVPISGIPIHARSTPFSTPAILRANSRASTPSTATSSSAARCTSGPSRSAASPPSTASSSAGKSRWSSWRSGYGATCTSTARRAASWAARRTTARRGASWSSVSSRCERVNGWL